MSRGAPLLATTALLCLGSCLHLQENSWGKELPRPPLDRDPTPISVQVGAPRGSLLASRTDPSGDMAEALERTGYVRCVAGGDQPAELTIRGLVRMTPIDPLLPAWVSGLTFMGIPNWGDYEVELRVRVTTPSGISRELQVTSTTHLILWAPLLVALPFEGTRYINGTYWDAAEALVGVLLDEGLLEAT